MVFQNPTRRRVLRWTVVFMALLSFVMVPWLLWGEGLGRWALEFSRHESAYWVQVIGFAGLLAADILLPVPSSFVAVAAGMALGKAMGTLVAATGLSLGCVVGYVLGARVGRRGALRFVGAEQLARVDAFAARFGDAVVLLLRSVPVLAECSVLFAGMTRVPLRRFVLVSTLANLLIAAVYATAGDLAAENDSYEFAIFVACAIPFVGMVLSRRFVRNDR